MFEKIAARGSLHVFCVLFCVGHVQEFGPLQTLEGFFSIWQVFTKEEGFLLFDDLDVTVSSVQA